MVLWLGSVTRTALIIHQASVLAAADQCLLSNKGLLCHFVLIGNKVGGGQDGTNLGQLTHIGQRDIPHQMMSWSAINEKKMCRSCLPLQLLLRIWLSAGLLLGGGE